MRLAFTLIELLVVIAIMAILAVIAIPQYEKYRVNAAYSKLQSQLYLAKAWAESVVADHDEFPNGTCDASSYSGSGSIKCGYNAASDNISVNASGSLSVDIPFKVTFTSNGTCGEIKVECPKDRCSGLKSSNGGNAVICLDTCGAVVKQSEDTNIHGKIGSCP